MNILVTGSNGFIGKNLCEALKNIRDGKDRRERYSSLLPLMIFEFDRESEAADLDVYCQDADFVFNLAGVNRPKDCAEFAKGNTNFVEFLVDALERHQNNCPVMFSSSTQASLSGRFADSEYGKSKLAGEKVIREHAMKTGAPALIYRFPNVYGKWSRPNYNSAVATFCYNIARELPIQVNDPDVELELLYIDDLVESLLDALLVDYRKGEGCDSFQSVAQTDNVTLGRIVNLLYEYKNAREALSIPRVEEGSFAKKLYSTYESFVDPGDLSYRLQTKSDDRGSFTELLKTPDYGQISLNVTAPGQTKGNHWHNTKWEKFIVVSGEGLVRQRRIGQDAEGNPYPTVEYHVSADEPTVIETPPGYTHCLVNPSASKDLVTIIWCNEIFDPEAPDTYYEEV